MTRLRSTVLASTLVIAFLSACGPSSTTPTTQGTSAAPNAASTCDPLATLVSQTEGPYYTPGAPERSDVTDADTAGTPLTLTGVVYDSSCTPVAGVRLDFWQADGAGRYDNSGFGLRGFQMTDAEGRYSLTTVIPGQYPGRTEHVHVKVTPPGGPTITSQLYFPGSDGNSEDRIYVASMEVTVLSESDSDMVASYDVVLP